MLESSTFRCAGVRRGIFNRKILTGQKAGKVRKSGLWHIYMPSVANMLTKKCEIFFCAQTTFLTHRSIPKTFLEKNFSGSGPVNTFATAVSHEISGFLVKILKTLEGCNSLNFKARRNLSPVLECLIAQLSDA